MKFLSFVFGFVGQIIRLVVDTIGWAVMGTLMAVCTAVMFALFWPLIFCPKGWLGKVRTGYSLLALLGAVVMIVGLTKAIIIGLAGGEIVETLVLVVSLLWVICICIPVPKEEAATPSVIYQFRRQVRNILWYTWTSRWRLWKAKREFAHVLQEIDHTVTAAERVAALQRAARGIEKPLARPQDGE